MNIFTRHGLKVLVTGSAVIGSLAVAGTALAAPSHTGFNHGFSGGQRPAVVGTVTAVNGDILTVAARSWQRNSSTTTPAATTTYTVDATNATVTKNGASSTVSNIVVGDALVVQGTVTGTSVTASSILDQGATSASGLATTPQTHKSFISAIGGFFSHLFGFF